MTEDQEYADILDNRQFTVKERANELAEGSDEIKIAVGYFYVSGFDLWRENAQDAESIQLVIGRQTNAETKEELVRGFSEDIDELEKNEDTAEGIKRLYELIQDDKVDVRIYVESRFHPKLYLFNYHEDTFPGAAIIGSSNLSPSGMIGNVELNVEKRDNNTLRYLNNWFDEIWEEGEEFKAELIEVIKSSKFADDLPEPGGEEIPENLVSPFTATKLYIYEQFKHEIEDSILFEDIEGEYEDVLADFQSDAVRAARYTLNKYNGVILADSVGLGKSYIGAPLVQEYSHPEAKILVVTPKRLEDMWKRLLSDEFPVHGRKRFISFAKLSRLGPNEINELRDYDIVLIDEAHKLRNQNTERYSNIQAIGRKDKKYILLTATPIHNSVTDLNNIIKIFADDKDFDIQLRDEPSELIRRYDKLSNQSDQEMTDSDRKKMERLREDIEKVMQEVLISRTREYILDSYDNITIGGEEIQAPERVPQLVSASDSDMEQLYRELIQLIAGEEEDDDTGLNLPYVSVQRYGERGDEEELEIDYRNASALLVILLFKRLESSLAAFEQSIDRLIHRENVMRQIAEGDFERSEDREEVMEYFESLDDEGELDDVDIDEVLDAVDELEQEEKKEIVNDVSEDLVDLKEVRKLAREALQEEGKDAKVEKLKELLEDDLEGEKALIFTKFIPTAEHIFKELTGKETLGNQVGTLSIDDRRVGYVHGDNFDMSIVEQFAPEAQEVEVGMDDEIDVLIATDVLGIGQNLQDSRVVVNYDLDWNPMNMEQRIGRIDRITTPHDELLIYNFIPTKDLEDALGILDRIRSKIQDISATFGHEAPILEESENLVNKNMIMYDKLSEGAEFQEEDFLGVTSKYDQLRNAVRSFCDDVGIGIEDLQQMESVRDTPRICFYPDVSEGKGGILTLANPSFTTGRTETRAMIVKETSFGQVDVGGQTMLTDIPIQEDDDLTIFQIMNSQDREKHTGDIEQINKVEEAFSDPDNWNNKILEKEHTVSSRIEELMMFCEEVAESNDFSDETSSRARDVKEDLEKYALSDYFENQLDQVYRKRNRWGWEKTVNELYGQVEKFELAEPEKVEDVEVILTEKLR